MMRVRLHALRSATASHSMFHGRVTLLLGPAPLVASSAYHELYTFTFLLSTHTPLLLKRH